MRESTTAFDNLQGLSTTSALDLVPPTKQGSLVVPEYKSQMAPDQQVDFSQFNPEQMRRIEQIAASVSLDDTGSMMSFAMEPQRRVNDVLDSLLAGVTAADAGVVGDLTIELATTIKAMNLAKMKREANGEDWFASSFGKLPLVGRYFSAFRHYQLTHKEITKHIESIEAKAEKDFTKVKAGVSKLDSVFDATLINIKELTLYVAAGHLVLQRACRDYKARAAIASERRDPVLSSQLRDFGSRMGTFENRLVRMHLGIAESLLALPQIRETQQAGSIEMFSIMDTLLFDMPKLKRLILMLAAVKSIRDAQRNERRRQEVLQEMDKVAGETVADVYLTALQSQGGGIARLAALSQTADTILQTLARGAELETENARARKQVIEGVGEVKRKFVADIQAQSERFIQSQQATL